MGRNFPSIRNLIEEIEEDLNQVKKLVKDKSLLASLEEIIEFLTSEAGAISVARNPILIAILLLIAKVMSNDGRNNNRFRDRGESSNLGQERSE